MYIYVVLQIRMDSYGFQWIPMDWNGMVVLHPHHQLLITSILMINIIIIIVSIIIIIIIGISIIVLIITLSL